MRSSLIGLLLLIFHLSVSAQREDHIAAFRAHIPAGIGKEIDLPDPGYGARFDLSRFQPQFGNTLIMVVVSDSMYRNVFSRFEKDSLPEIDFSRNELILYMACGQCLSVCQHNNGNTACHRNVCYYQRAWFIREKCGDS